MTKNFTIGIDLGTTYSCVGIWENDRPEIIANNYGDRTTPSCVIFTNDGQLIGEDVIDYLNIDPKNIISSVKRMMGKNFIDELLQSDIKRWPFKVIEKNNGKPYIQVNYKNEIKDFSPEEISAMILSKMKEIAEYYIGQEVTNAVITVPAFFNNAQREATKKAGEIAGLNILRIVNEPTAAAIAYSFDKLEPNDNINILVVDLGGGTFDVTLLNVNNRKFEVLASSGDTHLGGEDFDNQLVDHFVNEFQEKFKIDLTTNPKAMRRLKAKCESIKHKLSSSQKVKIYIDRLYDSIDFSSSITRSKFEEINMDLFKRIIKPFDNVIKDSGLKKSDIHKIVLVGGSCRIPKIQSLISEYFDRKDLSKNINSEEAVAQGATILSAYLSGINSDKINDIVLNEKIPFSLGVEVNEGIMYPLIESNTPIPTSKSKVFTTMRDNQTGICCKVYEGERLLTKGNNLLGEFKLTDISPSSHGKPKIKITFNIDENGILNASATDISTGKYSKIKIDYNKEVLSNEKKEQIINDAEKYKEEDKIEILRIRTRYNLEMYASNLLTLLNDPNIKSKIRKSSFNNFEKKIKSTINWIKNHQNESQKEYMNIKLELKNMEHSIKNYSFNINEEGCTIGIDLGTTYSSVGIWENDHVEIIPNDYGNCTIPSCVSFTNKLLVGEEAIDNANIYPENTIFSVNRMMGKDFMDEVLQSDIKHWPFKVIEKNNGKPYIQVKYDNEIKDFSPEEISAKILLYMKEIAEDYIGEKVTNAVITVPAYFNYAQCEATKIAGKIAGLNILRIVNEPTAAAIAYGFDKLEPNDNKNIIVINLEDLFNVSLLSIKDKKFEIKATSEYTHLSHEDFDNRLVDYFVNEFQEKFKIDLTTNSKARRRLKTHSERVRRVLSSSMSVAIEVFCLYNGIDFNSSITRIQFEKLNMDLFNKIIDLIEKVINDSGLSKSDIHEVILLEGSATIQKIHSMISEYFDGIKIHIPSNEVIVTGATILSANL